MLTSLPAWGFIFQYPFAVLLFFYNYCVYFIFFLVALILALTILFLQGKGDLGVVGAWQGSQTVFGGSGGQDLVGKFVWCVGFIFMALCLYLAKAEVKNKFKSVLAQYASVERKELPKNILATATEESTPATEVASETKDQSTTSETTSDNDSDNDDDE